MATKILFRRGNASAIPALSVGEPGWDIDTKTFRVGDGTTIPPRVPSTKSTGVFDFNSINEFRLPKMRLGQGTPGVPTLYFNETDTDSGFYSPGAGQIAVTSDGTQRLLINNSGIVVTGDIGMLTDGTKVDTVDVSNLNPLGVNGLMVKTGDSTYVFRSLVAGNGMAVPADGEGDANLYGETGNIIIAIATNPSLPGTGAVKIPAGTTAQRAGVAATDGHFRYNVQDALFEGFVDGEWRSMVDYMEQGKTIEVPTQFSTIQDAIDYYDSRSTRSNVFVKLEAGVHTVTETLIPGSRTGRVNIIGEDPVHVNLSASNPVHSISGSPGAWSITYNLASAVPAGITTDHSILINDMLGSGDIPFYSPMNSPNTQGINQLASDLNTLIPRNAALLDLTDIYAANDYIFFSSSMIGGHVRLISSVSPTAINHATLAGYEAMGDKFIHRKLKRLTGVCSSSGDYVLAGSGTAFLTELNVGDRLYTYNGDVVTVTAIASNVSASLSHRATFSNLVTLRFVAASMHCGCWKVDAIDTVNNRITVINTCRDPWAPPRYGLLSGRITFMPTAIVFTNQVLAQIVEGEFLAFNNLTVRYTGTAHATQINYGVSVQGGDAEFGQVGFNRCTVFVGEGGDLSYKDLSVSAVNFGQSYALHIQDSRAVGSRVFVTGNAGDGLLCSTGTFNVVSKGVYSGNTKRGCLIQVGGGAYPGFHMSAECNGSEGLRVHGSSCFVGSALVHNNGVRVAGTIEGVGYSMGATGEFWDNSFVTYSGRACMIAYAGSNFVVTNAIFANSNVFNNDYARGHGVIGAHQGSFIQAVGCRCLNSHSYGVTAHLGSSVLFHGSNIANTGAYINQNTESPAAAFNGSFIHLVFANAAAMSAYTGSVDLAAYTQSAIVAWRSYGIGGLNSFASSPPPNTDGNNNSTIQVYG